MTKLSASFYKHDLLPSLYKAKQSGANIRSKSSLIHFYEAGTSHHLWACCATAEDLSDTADLVDRMISTDDDILSEIGISEATVQTADEYVSTPDLMKLTSSLRKSGKVEQASKLQSYVEARSSEESARLNKMLWQSKLKVIAPDRASSSDVARLAREAKEFLKNQTKSDDTVIEEAVTDFIDQVYLSDIDFKGTFKPNQVLSDLYYKHKDDELDSLEIDSDLSEEEINLGMREVKKFLI